MVASRKVERALRSVVLDDMELGLSVEKFFQNLEFEDSGCDHDGMEAVISVGLTTSQLGARSDMAPPEFSIFRSEAARKGAHKSYKSVGKKEKQEELFPQLREEIQKKRLELYKDLPWESPESRRTPEFIEELKKQSMGRIGGSPEEQRMFFEKVIARYPQCFWIEGCAAPFVKGHIVKFRLKENAKPVARQPLPVSPYDEMRVEFHLKRQ